MPSAPFRCSRPVDYHSAQVLGPDLSYVPYDAGHILGSSCVVLHEGSNGARVRLAFSGDVGRPESADHPRPGADAAGRLPDSGEHLRRPPP